MLAVFPSFVLHELKLHRHAIDSNAVCQRSDCNPIDLRSYLQDRSTWMDQDENHVLIRSLLVAVLSFMAARLSGVDVETYNSIGPGVDREEVETPQVVLEWIAGHEAYSVAGDRIYGTMRLPNERYISVVFSSQGDWKKDGNPGFNKLLILFDEFKVLSCHPADVGIVREIYRGSDASYVQLSSYSHAVHQS